MRILITGGPTREPIDAVRFIGNRSSGKTAVALASAAVDAGHEVTLLLGPCGAVPPAGVSVLRFETTAEHQERIDSTFEKHDVLIMAAAVADYRPVATAEGKMPRRAGEVLELRLEATPDVVAAAARKRRADQRMIAFALEETGHLEANARGKLVRKGVDAIVANPLKTTGADTVEALWLTADGERESPGAMSKDDLGRWVIARLDTLGPV